MDDDTLELIVRLCTRAGASMEDASVIALTVAFGLGLNATIHYLNRLRLEDRPGEVVRGIHLRRRIDPSPSRREAP